LSDRLEIVLDYKVDKDTANILSKTNTFVSSGTNNGIVITQSGSGVPLKITNTGTGNSFLVEDSASTDSTPFVISASGNVGIGKTTPTVLLDVAGVGAFSGALTASTFNALSLVSNATGYTISGGTTAVAVTFAGGAAYTVSGTNATTITLPATTGTLALNNQAFFIGTQSIAINAGTGTITALPGVSSINGSTIPASVTLAANVTTTLGDLIYASANGTPGTLARLAGNTTTTKQFLSQTGNGTISAVPAWSALANGDIPTALTGKSYNGLTLTSTTGTFTLAALKTFTVNNTMTFSSSADGNNLNIGAGGTLGSAAFTASTAYEPAFTTLPISKGGTGTGTAPTQYGVIYASSATTYASTSAGTAGQVLTVNGTANGYTWSTPLTNPMTTAGDIIYGGASGAATRLAGSATNGHVLTYNTATSAPQWSAPAAGYSAPTLGSTSIASGATVSNVNGLTINSTTIPTSATLLTSGSSFNLGTTSIVLNRASAAQSLTGISIDGNAGSATVSVSSNSLRQSDGTSWLNPVSAIGSTGSRGTSLAPSTYNHGLFSEFKNATFGLATVGANYGGLLTYANWTGTTASTGDSSYQILFSPVGGNSTSVPFMQIRAGIDSAWGNWGVVQTITVNTTAKTSAYQLTTADASTIIQMNGAFAFNIDTSLAVLPAGTTITLVALTAGVTIATTANATVPTLLATPGLKFRAANSVVTLVKMSVASSSGTASTWLVTGDLTA
jgi:hypothetical protein